MRRFTGIFLVILAMSACSWPGRLNDRNTPAGSMISEIMSVNNALAPFKGLGNIRIKYDKISMSVRAAWIADPQTRRLRVEIMGPGGRPGGRIVADGSAVFFYWYDNGCLRSRRVSGKNLEPIVHIPINVDELIFFLAGSIPVCPHDDFFVNYVPDSYRRVAVLKKRWRGVVEKIGFDAAWSGVVDVEVYGWFGSRFRAEVIKIRGPETGSAGFVIKFFHGNARVSVESERQWRDVKVPEGAFDALQRE